MNPIERILSFVAPHICVGCGGEGAALCMECIDAINPLPSICYRCGKGTKQYKPCQICIRARGPQHVWAAFAYDKLPKTAIQAYKFEERRAMARCIANVLDNTLPYFADAPLVTFVPTSTSHRRARGFDHAECITRELAKLRGWRYARLLHRSLQVRQLGASRAKRKTQLKGAFRAVNTPFIQSRHILLVDDVVTTGATIEECTKVLYKAGAKQVDVAVFASTPNTKPRKSGA